MSFFIKKQKVFISHKRINGTASPEAVLLKQLLDKNYLLDTFLDIHEDTLGEFPASLRKKIDESDSFIFLIPSDGNISFLYNRKGWVYKEIDNATYRYLAEDGNTIKSPFQILPVTFSKTFKWPEDLPQSIKSIGRLDPCRLNLNDKPDETQTELVKALNIQVLDRVRWRRVILSTILLVLATFLGVKLVKSIADDRLNENRVAFIKSSFEGRIATSIQPSFVIPSDERTSLQDSIYKFFELRDKFYHDLRSTPAINHKKVSYISSSRFKDAGIAQTNNKLSIRRLLGYSRYILDNIIPSNIDTTDVVVLFAAYLYRESIQDTMKDINDQLDYLTEIIDIVAEKQELLNHQKYKYSVTGKKTKEEETEARYNDDYMLWHLMDQMTVLCEMTAQMCNRYLTAPMRDILW